MPLKNNTSAYQRLKQDIDNRAAQYNQTQEALYNAVHPVSSNASPKTEEAKRVRQRQLKNMGLYSGEIDGKWGKKSEAAHREALRRGYTYSNGMYSQKPKAMQPIAGKPLTDTQKRQAQLKEMGFYQGKIDDKFGPMSRAAHQRALDAGYIYDNGTYTRVKPEEEKKELGLDDKIVNSVLRIFPAARQIRNSLLSTGSGYTQTNKDFSDKYLENLSQLGQVAYRQHVRKHGYPKPGELFPLSLTPETYMEINPSGKYASFKDIPALLNAAVGGNRQVEYTDGGMSGQAYVDENGTVHWNATDNAAWDFDSPEQIERLKGAAKRAHPGSALRYAMGKLQEKQNEHGYQPIRQNLKVTFPFDTITVNPARYDNVPRYKQKR